MTARQLIAEFILLGIKENDLVEIQLGRNNFIKGYIVDKDVFPNLSIKDELRNKLYGLNITAPKKIRIMQIVEDDEIEKKLKESMMINFDPVPKFPIDILPEQIVSIRKL